MATTGQRLVELSGLPTGTAGAHLVAMSTAGFTAAQRLLSRSPLPTATAIVHLANASSGGIVAGREFIMLRRRRRL
jgi:hypothetical protein